MSHSNFTSLPPEQEQHFVVFENRTVEMSKKAWTMGLLAAGAVFLFFVILYAASDPPPNTHSEGLESDMSAETAKRRAPAPAPAAAPTPKPESATPAEPAAAAGEAPAEGAEAAKEAPATP